MKWASIVLAVCLILVIGFYTVRILLTFKAEAEAAFARRWETAIEKANGRHGCTSTSRPAIEPVTAEVVTPDPPRETSPRVSDFEQPESSQPSALDDWGF